MVKHASAKKRTNKVSKRRANRRAQMPKSEVAVLKQTLELNDDNMNQVYRYNTCNLSAFDRAVQVARAYQFYRIKLIEYKFKPFSDTYAPGGDPTTGGPITPSVPYLYWLINKGDTMDPSSFNALRDAGAKPIRFDDKTLTVRWVPNVLINTPSDPVLIGTNFQMSRRAPWLSTNEFAGTSSATWQPSSQPHTGILYGVEQEKTVPNVVFTYGVEVTVHFEFKKPLTFSDNKGMVATVKETIKKPE